MRLVEFDQRTGVRELKTECIGDFSKKEMFDGSLRVMELYFKDQREGILFMKT